MTAQLENKNSPSGDSGDFSVTNKTKARLPRAAFVHFEEMKNMVLGADYSLSLVIADDTLSQKLNRERRGHDRPTDILSFSLDEMNGANGTPAERAGEIFLNLGQCKKKAPKFDRAFENYLGFVFIHGLLHLKGFDHGSTMESEEEIVRKKFGI